jgi:hypothetical protein
MHYLLNLERFKIYIKIHTKYRSYMFRSTTIIRELVLNLAKVIFILKHSVKIRRYMLFGDLEWYFETADSSSLQLNYKLWYDSKVKFISEVLALWYRKSFSFVAFFIDFFERRYHLHLRKEEDEPKETSKGDPNSI